MKRMLKKSVTWLLLFTMLMSLVTAMTVGVSAAEVTLPQKAGNNISVYYDSATQTLRLRGSGAMYDYVEDGTRSLVSKQPAPWDHLRDDIKHVEIGSGITTIGNAAFYLLNKCTDYNIASTVTEIGEWAFANNTNLQSITIPSSVRKICHWAFHQTGLTSDLQRNSKCLGNPVIEAKAGSNGDLIKDLDQDSFNRVVVEMTGNVVNTDTNSTSQVDWHYSSTTKTLTLTTTATEPVAMPPVAGEKPWSMFNSNITKIVVGNNIENIGREVFTGMTSVSSVQLGQDVAIINERAFAGCTALKQLQLPLATLIIEAGAFSSRGMGNTITVSTPNSEMIMTPGNDSADDPQVVWQYGSATVVVPPSSSTAQSGILDGGKIGWTFAPLSGTLSLTLAPTVTAAAIPDFASPALTPWAQAGLNSSILSVHIGDGITRIGSYAFANMPYLQLVTIGKQVQSVGYFAFYNDTALALLSFPLSVSLVESSAFTGCSSLWYAEKKNTAMVVQSPNNELIAAITRASGSTPVTPPPSTGSSVGGTIAGTTITWSYNNETNALNITGSGAIPNYTLTTSAPWANYINSITAITVQSGITAIGDYAFANSKNAVDINIPDTVKTIGKNAFYGCTSLKSIRLPGGLTSLGDRAFYNCGALESIDLPDSLTVIEDETFAYCKALQKVELPANLQRIDSKAFFGCTALTMVDFPSALIQIGEEAFYGCTALAGVVFRSSA